MNTLSLDNSPSVFKTLQFYIISCIFLILFSFYQLMNQESISERWNNQVIVLVHIFTLGHILPIIIGSFTQFMPVLFGIEIDFKKDFRYFLITIPACIVSYSFHFHKNTVYQNYINIFLISIFWLNLVYFIFIYLKKALQKLIQQKKYMFALLSIAILNLFISVLISISLVLVHFGFSLPIFRPNGTDIHFQFMTLGFIQPLMLCILSNIIPMFYITKQTSKTILKLGIISCIILYLKTMFTNDSDLSTMFTYLLIFINIVIASSLLHQIYSRKRKNSDQTIYLWYYTFSSFIVANITWAIKNLNFFDDSIMEMIIGKIVFLGIVLGAINAMLLKIIPFLTWLHLSQQQLKLNRFDVKIPHLGILISNTDKYLSLFFVVLILPFQVLNFYTISSFLIIGLALNNLKIIAKNMNIYSKTMTALVSRSPL